MDKTVPASDSDLENWIQVQNEFDPEKIVATFNISRKPQVALVIGLRLGTWSQENNIAIKACNVVEIGSKYQVSVWVEDEADAMAIKLWWT